MALAVLTLAGGVIRLSQLGHPRGYVFDEVYYAKQACWSASHSLELCDLTSAPIEVHPPLGKLLIALGIRLFGFNSWGWRIVPALVGIASIVLLYVLARTILRSTLAATVSAGLLVVCFLHFVHSRAAMLDILIATFGLAAFTFIALDRQRLLERVSSAKPTHRVPRWQPYKFAAGISAGAATASKWSGLLIWVAIVVLSIAWSRHRIATSGVPSARRLRPELPGIAIYLGLVPIVVYLASHVGQIQGDLLAPLGHDGWLANFWNEQVRLFRYHTFFPAVHPHQSPPWSWLLLKRPVVYFFCTGTECQPDIDDGSLSEILATGNPLVWWLSIPLMLGIAVRWLRRRDVAGPGGIILMGFAATYLPWFLLTLDRSQVFLFYVLPTLPFAYLAFGYAARVIAASWEGRLSIGLFSLGVVALFVYYYPLLTARPMSPAQWNDRLWIFDECAEGGDEAMIPATITGTSGGEDGAATAPAEGGTQQDQPSGEKPRATGWCWA